MEQDIGEFESYLEKPDSFICDSSSLISLADSCFLPVLAKLKQHFEGEFLITEGVRHECVDYPLKTKSHTLPALRLQLAINDGVLKVTASPGLSKTTEDILWMANNIFYLKRRPLAILHQGEAETLALADELGLRHILIDERTTRILIEAPEDLRAHLEREFGPGVEINSKYLDRFHELTSSFELFRSSELVVLAYEKGYFKQFRELEKQAVEAALYGLKFAGCSISFEEIAEYTKSLAVK